MEKTMAITNESLESFSKKYNEKIENKLLTNAIIKNGINNTAINNDCIIDMPYNFSEELETGKITSQKKSGRCWLFAGLNTFRYKISKKLNLKQEDFELSQGYLMFWDKLEKANYFLENIIETRKEAVDNRVVMWLLDAPMQDGGQWDMFLNLVEKYGVIPKTIMPESYHSSNSMVMNRLLTLRLRKNAVTLRKMAKQGKNIDEIRNEKEKMMKEFYGVLCHFLGEPPKKFDFEYRDKDNKFYRDNDITPIEFYKKYLGINIRDYVSIINAPTSDKPFNKTFTVKYLGNVVGGKAIHYLNLEIEELKKLAISQMKAGELVWFGCDVGKMSDRDLGIMDTDIYNYDQVLNTDLSLSKEDRLNYGESCLTHAMVFTGVNIVDGKPNRWKVENSWGEEPGNKGFFVMSDEWFEQFIYQVVINKKYLSKEQLQALEQEAIELNPWDPMGSLALMK
jgi:bleomycin hydrolase